MFVGFRHELEHPEHVSVVADGQGGHIILRSLLVQRFDRGSPVEQGVLGVYVKV